MAVLVILLRGSLLLGRDMRLLYKCFCFGRPGRFLIWPFWFSFFFYMSLTDVRFSILSEVHVIVAVL